jgi:Cu/Ag efflux pump CusA
MPSHSNWAAVSDRRGSMTTTLPARLTMSCIRSLIRGAVKKLPCETTGFAPIITNRSVRMRSGIGTDIGVP